MNNLSSTLTKTNLAILSLIAEEELALREIAEKIRCSPGKVHHAIQMFKKQGMVTLEKRKNKIVPRPKRSNALYQKIKALINVQRIMGARTYTSLTAMAAVGIYGSYAQGTDDALSDIDLILVTRKRELEVREHIRHLENELGKRINPLFITKQKLQQLETADAEFYLRLKLTIVTLHGDIFE